MVEGVPESGGRGAEAPAPPATTRLEAPRRGEPVDRPAPPFFPPGAGKRRRSAGRPPAISVTPGLPEEALILPDEPSGPGKGAGPATLDGVAARLEALARELRARGEEALRPAAGADSFEVALRGFVAGYLAGREEGPRG